MSDNGQPEYYIQISRPGMEPQAGLEGLVEGSAERFHTISTMVEHASEALVHKLRSLEIAPKSCSIEFGVDVGGEAGIPLITKGTIGANFKVTVCWETKG